MDVLRRQLAALGTEAALERGAARVKVERLEAEAARLRRTLGCAGSFYNWRALAQVMASPPPALHDDVTAARAP